MQVLGADWQSKGLKLLRDREDLQQQRDKARQANAEAQKQLRELNAQKASLQRSHRDLQDALKHETQQQRDLLKQQQATLCSELAAKDKQLQAMAGQWDQLNARAAASERKLQSQLQQSEARGQHLWEQMRRAMRKLEQLQEHCDELTAASKAASDADYTPGGVAAGTGGPPKAAARSGCAPITPAGVRPQQQQPGVPGSSVLAAAKGHAAEAGRIARARTVLAVPARDKRSFSAEVIQELQEIISQYSLRGKKLQDMFYNVLHFALREVDGARLSKDQLRSMVRLPASSTLYEHTQLWAVCCCPALQQQFSKARYGSRSWMVARLPGPSTS
jgi:hypothetical protein